MIGELAVRFIDLAAFFLLACVLVVWAAIRMDPPISPPRRQFLTGSLAERAQFRITDAVDSNGRIEDRTFQNCEIFGPGVLHVDSCSFFNVEFDTGTPERAVWKLAEVNVWLSGGRRGRIASEVAGSS